MELHQGGIPQGHTSRATQPRQQTSPALEVCCLFSNRLDGHGMWGDLGAAYAYVVHACLLHILSAHEHLEQRRLIFLSKGYMREPSHPRWQHLMPVHFYELGFLLHDAQHDTGRVMQAVHGLPALACRRLAEGPPATPAPQHAESHAWRPSGACRYTA